MSCVCKYDISVPCNDKSIYSCDMCKEHPMYEQGRADKYQEITSEYMLLTEKQVAEIRADAIDECIKSIEESKSLFDNTRSWTISEKGKLQYRLRKLKERKNEQSNDNE